MLAPSWQPTDPLRALLDDVRSYDPFNFDRAPLLEIMSGRFAQTPAGLQHAAHLYEGENKMLGQRLADSFRTSTMRWSMTRVLRR